MNRTPDVELVLRDYFADDGLTAPDYVLEVVEQRIGRQPRRRAWRLPRRLQPMNRTLTYVAGLAAVLVIAVVGYNLLPRNGTGGPGPGPTATVVPATAAPTSSLAPTQPPSPSAAAVFCDKGTKGCLGVLTGGTYTSANFKPTLTYTIPAGPAGGPPASSWANTYDLGRAYTLVPPGGAYAFQVISELAIPEQTSDCSPQQKAGAGNTVADWVDFITKNPGLNGKAPVPVTIGGFSGFSIKFAVASSWKTTCPDSVGPAVLTWMHSGTTQLGVRMIDDQQVTYWFLDVGGETVLISVESAPSEAVHTADVANAQPIIDTFQFTPR